MKKKYYGNDDVITVYKFMERCGLHCEVKGNICVSHEIMMRKLRARNEKFPDKVIVPESIAFGQIEKEDVKTGKTILVKDDTKQIRAYHLPTRLIEPMTPEQREYIRKEKIEEKLSEPVFDATIKPGYMKYLYRKAMKESLAETKEVLNKEDEYDDYMPNIKVNRLKKVDKKRY